MYFVNPHKLKLIL